MKEAIIQISCFSTTYPESRAMAKAVVAALLPEATVMNKPDVQAAITARLMADSAVQAFFAGAVPQKRITWMARTQGEPLPAIVLVTIGGEDISAHLDNPPESGTRIEFWYGSANEPRDLGQQEATGFIHHAAVDMTIRYARTA